MLDDIHRIREQAVFDLLKELLLHPPRFVHLVLIGRSDPPLPINSWRARRSGHRDPYQGAALHTPADCLVVEQAANRQIDKEVAAEWTRSDRRLGDSFAPGSPLAALPHLEEGLQVNTQGDTRYLKEYLLAEVLSRLPVA